MQARHYNFNPSFDVSKTAIWSIIFVFSVILSFVKSIFKALKTKSMPLKKLEFIKKCAVFVDEFSFD